MPFSHDTGVFNVQGTLANWMVEQLNTNQPPSVSSVTVVFDYEEEPIEDNLPCWSITFLGEDEDPGSFIGGRLSETETGNIMAGIMQVDAWTSRETIGWRKQLAQMVDAVRAAVASVKASGSAVIIKDFYTDEDTPSNLAYRIVIDRMAVRAVDFDPNPDIKRKRMLVYYTYTERV